MIIIKFLLMFLLVSIMFGMWFVRVALKNNVHIPTNNDLIYGTKAYINSLKTPKKEKRIVKASSIRKLGK